MMGGMIKASKFNYSSLCCMTQKACCKIVLYLRDVTISGRGCSELGGGRRFFSFG